LLELPNPVLFLLAPNFQFNCQEKQRELKAKWGHKEEDADQVSTAAPTDIVEIHDSPPAPLQPAPSASPPAADNCTAIVHWPLPHPAWYIDAGVPLSNDANFYIYQLSFA
jgi:hypothetical protein